MEAALASAERQIERLRVRERGQARALMEARHQLHEASSASSAISEDCTLSPEAGARLSGYAMSPIMSLSQVLPSCSPAHCRLPACITCGFFHGIGDMKSATVHDGILVCKLDVTLTVASDT